MDRAGFVSVPQCNLAVLVPAFNEACAIAKVVGDFKAALPGCAVYVYDNNSSDATRDCALRAGAIVRRERLQGKGHVVRRMFADVQADIYVLVDGDDTYDAGAAAAMVAMLADQGLDMVTGVRVSDSVGAYRRGHRFGNRVLTGLVRRLFGAGANDMLSGYRVLSRRFVKSFPALSQGFETETEMTVHALELNMPVGECATGYRDRAAGSASKLNTVRDGLRILRLILVLVKEERPLQLFGAVGALLLLGGVALGGPVVLEFSRTGLVPRLPTALLATALELLAFLAGTCGLILESVSRGRRETKRLAYLAVAPTGAG